MPTQDRMLLNLVIVVLIASEFLPAACHELIGGSTVGQVLESLSDLFLHYECAILGTQPSADCSSLGPTTGILSPYDVVQQVPAVQIQQNPTNLLEELAGGRGGIQDIFHEREQVLGKVRSAAQVTLVNETTFLDPRLTGSQLNEIVNGQRVQIDECTVYMPLAWNETSVYSFCNLSHSLCLQMKNISLNSSNTYLANQYFIAQDGNVVMLSNDLSSSKINDLAMLNTSWYKHLMYPSKRVVFVLDAALFSASVCAAMDIAMAQVEALIKYWVSPVDLFQLILASERPYVVPSASGKSLLSASQEHLRLVTDWAKHNDFTNVSYSNLTAAVDVALDYLAGSETSNHPSNFIVMLSSVNGFAGNDPQSKRFSSVQNRTIFVGIVVDDAVTMNTMTSTKFLNDLKCEIGGTVVRLALTQDGNSSQFGKCSIMSSLLPDTPSTFLKDDREKLIALSSLKLIQSLKTVSFEDDRRIWSIHLPRSSADTWNQSHTDSFIAALEWSCGLSPPGAVGVIRADYSDEVLMNLLELNSFYPVKSFRIVSTALLGSLDALTMQVSYSRLATLFDEARSDQMRLCCSYIPIAMQRNSSCVEFTMQAKGSGRSSSTGRKLMFCWRAIAASPLSLVGRFQLSSSWTSPARSSLYLLQVPAISFLPLCQEDNRTQRCWNNSYSTMAACFHRLDLLRPLIPARFSYPWGGTRACGTVWCTYDTSVWFATPAALYGRSSLRQGDLSLQELLALNEQIKSSASSTRGHAWGLHPSAVKCIQVSSNMEEYWKHTLGIRGRQTDGNALYIDNSTFTSKTRSDVLELFFGCLSGVLRSYPGAMRSSEPLHNYTESTWFQSALLNPDLMSISTPTANLNRTYVTISKALYLSTSPNVSTSRFPLGVTGVLLSYASFVADIKAKLSGVGARSILTSLDNGLLLFIMTKNLHVIVDKSSLDEAASFETYALQDKHANILQYLDEKDVLVRTCLNGNECVFQVNHEVLVNWTEQRQSAAAARGETSMEHVGVEFHRVRSLGPYVIMMRTFLYLIPRSTLYLLVVDGYYEAISSPQLEVRRLRELVPTVWGRNMTEAFQAGSYLISTLPSPACQASSRRSDQFPVASCSSSTPVWLLVIYGVVGAGGILLLALCWAMPKLLRRRMAWEVKRALEKEQGSWDSSSERVKRSEGDAEHAMFTMSDFDRLIEKQKRLIESFLRQDTLLETTVARDLKGILEAVRSFHDQLDHIQLRSAQQQLKIARIENLHRKQEALRSRLDEVLRRAKDYEEKHKDD